MAVPLQPLELETNLKAIIVRAPGGLDRIERVELPDPGAPGPGAIRVRLHASSLNFHDYGVVSTPNRVSDGRIPMSDGAGLVESIGDGVTEFKVGDHASSLAFSHLGWKDRRPLPISRPFPAIALIDTRASSWWRLRPHLPMHPKDIRSPRLRLSPRPA